MVRPEKKECVGPLKKMKQEIRNQKMVAEVVIFS